MTPLCCDVLQARDDIQHGLCIICLHEKEESIMNMIREKKDEKE